MSTANQYFIFLSSHKNNAIWWYYSRIIGKSPKGQDFDFLNIGYQLNLLPDKDLVDLCPHIEPYQVPKSR